jgi:hypothetical protein
LVNLFTRDDAPPRPASAFWNLFTHADAHSVSAPVVGGQALPAALDFNAEQIFWALRNLPVREAVKHLAILGTTSGGKSTLIQLYLQSIAPRFRPGWPHPEQLILFDGKNDAVPLLAALGFNPEDDNVHILNPYDERGVAWDLADGAQGPLLARHLAALLVPEEQRSTAPYFPDSARDLLYAVILALNKVAGSRWQLRDLICALDTPARIRAITAQHSRASIIASRIMDDDKHAFGVLSSLGTKMVRFEPVAALWHSTPNPRRFRIQEFLQKPGVLVLGNDEALRDSLWPINALLLKALTQEILRRPGSRQPRHWFVLDEFPAMAKVDCIHDLLRRGRSKGASVLLGMQGKEALNEVYGENAADDMLSQCAYKTFLRAGGPKTAEWAESFFGKVRHTEQVWSESWGRDGHSSSVQYSVIERSLFLASVFSNLPLPEPGGPFVAISDVPCLGSTLISRRWFDQVLAWLLPPLNIPEVVPRDHLTHQTLEGWETAEETRFCGPTPPPAEEKPTESQPKTRGAKALPDPKARKRARRVSND